ncbi:MAG: leucine-rich repeat protein [Clostridia bacterium]|nr:leucine-rich repeat protein [Clostridia bacterium]
MKMKPFLSLLAILSLLLCIAGAMAEDAPQYFIEGDYAYRLTDSGAVLEHFVNTEPLPEEITLPTEIGGQPIVAYGFVYYTARTDGPVRVIVPEGVTDFGDAFGETNAITEIVLPASLSHIAEGSLLWGDPEIIVHPDNPYFTCENGFLIDTRTSTLLYVAPSGQNEPLPAVNRLGDFCLYNYNMLEPVLPDTLTAIGSGVFDDWVYLTHIDIPAGVTEIGRGAFNCTSLTEITLPAGLTAIEALTFSCNSFTEIVIPDGVQYIDSWAFYMCPLKRVEIPASCTFVAHDAFDPEVELVLLGENTHVETAEELEARERGTEHIEGNYGYALTDEGTVITNYFWDEVFPAEIVVPDTLGGLPVVGVAGFAFYDPSSDVQWPPEGACIRLPEGMQFLESGAFYSCWSVRQVQLPASLESVGENAFWYFGGDIVVAERNPRFTCENGFLIDTRTGTLLYTAASAPDGMIPPVKRIGARALDNQLLPADLVLPEGIEELAGHAFYDTKVRTVTLPQSLRMIETSAFESMTVTSGRIVVPAGVEVVEYGAFDMHTPMKAEVVILGENTRIETAEEYFRRTGEVWVLEDGWEPNVYTPGWQ